MTKVFEGSVVATTILRHSMGDVNGKTDFALAQHIISEIHAGEYDEVLAELGYYPSVEPEVILPKAEATVTITAVLQIIDKVLNHTSSHSVNDTNAIKLNILKGARSALEALND